LKKIKTFIAGLFAAILAGTFAVASYGYPPFVAKAKKFGAKDCTFCHVDPLGGPPWNERGQWLIDEKERLKADVIDVEWLATFKPKNGSKTISSGSSTDTKPAEPRVSGGAVEQQLTALIDQMVESAKRKDFASFASLLADDFTEVSPDGKVMTRAALLQDLPNYNLESYKRTEVSTRVFGDTAVMTLRQTSKGTYKGQEAGGEFRETIVWAKKDGRWQMVAVHVSRIAP
jgi:ketosteroid isomerase-like protein